MEVAIRIAILSDLHANLLAFDAVLADPRFKQADQVVCLGDAAASGPQPRQVLEKLSALNCPVVMGNAADGLLQPRPCTRNDAFSRMITAIDAWCAEQLSPDDLSYMRTFLPRIKIDLGEKASLLCYHGSPLSNTDLIEATTSDEELARLFSSHQATFLAGGHAHTQMLRRFEESLIINPGSVGLPFEHAPHGTYNVPWAEYALLEWEQGGLQVAFQRVPYDVSELKMVALASGMPHADWWGGEWRGCPRFI